MSTYYWDLYVLYIKNCEKENYINDIDPNHYQMEWNHFWPQCVFGEWNVGQWLTLRQHAIASALQTLVFKENCMCGWHKQYLPPNLLALAWPYFCKASSERSKKFHTEKNDYGKSVNAVKGGIACHADKDENGKSLHSLKLHAEKDENGKSLLGIKGSARLHSEKDENGKSVQAVKLHAEKDENGKSLQALKGNAALHSEKDENGKSLVAKKAGAAAAAALSKRVRVTFPDGSQRIFKSSQETSRFLSVDPAAISYRIKHGAPKCKSKLSGYRFELA